MDVGKKKRAVITGGAGFIGSHLARCLLDQGYEVDALDVVSPTQPLRGVRYHSVDVRKAQSLEPFMATADVVYHFAAIVSVPECETKPQLSYETNFMGTLNVAEAIKKSGSSARLIFASSSAVYSNLGREGLKLSERLGLPDPASLYAAQKLASEQLLRIYSRQHGLPVSIFRFFNVYGPGQASNSPYSGVISKFNSVLSGGTSPVQIHGTGAQTRDFIWVEDVARACLLAATTPLELCDGRPWNLGTGVSVSVLELSALMKELWGVTLEDERVEERRGDVRHSTADSSAVQVALGWKPQVSLKEGLSNLKQRISTQRKAA